MLLFVLAGASSIELELGTERIKPGIVFIFEGAIKDSISPSALHLPENQTHVHIEARANWDEKKIPKAAVPGGFIPYLHITVQITNQKTGLSTFVDAVPHVNLIDNFHYARNISLPGAVTDLYTVVFTVLPPSPYELGIHKDWSKSYKNVLFDQKKFTYKNVNFKEIAEATR